MDMKKILSVIYNADKITPSSTTVLVENKLTKYMRMIEEGHSIETVPAVTIEENPVDRVTMDVPLLIRLFEYAREDAKTDMDLHDVAERLIRMSKTGDTLTMNDYDSIVADHESPELPSPDEDSDSE
jgi:hypothetical protein